MLQQRQLKLLLLLLLLLCMRLLTFATCMHALMPTHTQVEQWIERERVTMQKEREEKEQSILSQKLNSLGMYLLNIATKTLQFRCVVSYYTFTLNKGRCMCFWLQIHPEMKDSCMYILLL
jgi:hypothetical protein